MLTSHSAFAASCRPVRQYTYTLPVDVALSCAPRSATVFDLDIPDRGRFLVRADLRLRGTGTVPELVHGWSARWSRLGDPGFPRRIAHAAGEDLCAGETRSKGMLGFGKLTAAARGVALAINAYRASDCENGAVTIGAGSSLELWIEDPAPGCEGKDIAAFSYFARQQLIPGDAKDRAAPVDARPRSIVEGSIAPTAPLRRLDIIGQTEISPPATENTCTRRDEYGGAWLYVNGASIAGGYQADTYPPSDGMTHLLLTPSVAVLPREPGPYRFGIAAAVRQSGREPAVVGTDVSGDSIVAAIAHRLPPPASAP